MPEASKVFVMVSGQTIAVLSGPSPWRVIDFPMLTSSVNDVAARLIVGGDVVEEMSIPF